MECCLPVGCDCLPSLKSLRVPSLLIFCLTGSPEHEHLDDRDVIVLVSVLVMGGFLVE